MAKIRSAVWQKIVRLFGGVLIGYFVLVKKRRKKVFYEVFFSSRHSLRAPFRTRRTHWWRLANYDYSVHGQMDLNCGTSNKAKQKAGHQGQWQNGPLGTVPSVPLSQKQNQTKVLPHNKWDTGDGGKTGRLEPSLPSHRIGAIYCAIQFDLLCQT